MAICKECGIEFQERKSWEKYCTIRCRKRFNQRKKRQRIQSDPKKREERNRKERERKKALYSAHPELKKIRNKIEVERRKIKLMNDPEARKKKNEYEKLRQWKMKGIKSASDFKRAPKGSGCLTKHGYRKIHKPDHPNCWKNGDIFEHVFVMSEYIGRALQNKETVHHKNGIKSDNRIENLELWSNSHPFGQRVEDKIAWCKEFLELYGYNVIMTIDKAITAKD